MQSKSSLQANILLRGWRVLNFGTKGSSSVESSKCAAASSGSVGPSREECSAYSKQCSDTFAVRQCVRSQMQATAEA